MARNIFCFLGVLSLLSLAACGGGSNSGKVSLGITDAPVDSAQSVVVQFSGVAFKRQDSDTETVENITPQSIDLLQYQDGKVALLLDGIDLPSGTYEWVRLMVNAEPNVVDSYLVDNSGARCELTIPSGAQSGLKLNRGFTLDADGSVALTIDFDLRQSVHAPPGQASGACSTGYLLRPTLRLVDDAQVGAISGTVDPSLITTGCVPAVYIYSGSNVVPDDIELTTSMNPDIDPLATATVTMANGAATYSYQAAFIPAGNYTATFTCSADDPTLDENLVFVDTQNVTVQNIMISTVGFPTALGT
jgi:hypothetical protein